MDENKFNIANLTFAAIGALATVLSVGVAIIGVIVATGPDPAEFAKEVAKVTAAEVSKAILEARKCQEKEGCNPSSAQAKQPMVLTLNRHWRQYQDINAVFPSRFDTV
ncbi:MAG: hypothetical protein BECKG1743E_GA0114224_105891, partial [Candidatus Kentron sp. G]